MRFSTWRRSALACLVAAFVLLVTSRATAQWRVVPEIGLALGNESDVVVDPSVNRVVVPGGPFAELTPRLSMRSWIGRDAMLDLGTFASLQEFFNDESRLLYAQTIWGNLYQNFGRSLRARLSTALDYFDDSERDDVRRFGYGAEAGLGFLRPLWNLELWGAAYGRTYPGLTVTDMHNQTSTYTETTWSGAGTLRIAPAGRVSVTAEAIYQATDALDSYYDADSWTASGSIDARVVSSLFVTLSGAYQERDFVDRVAPGDEDEYLQAGAGLRYTVASNWMILARMAISNYTWPDGSDEDSHRYSIGVNYAWGRRDSPPPPRADIETIVRKSEGAIQEPDADGRVVFRMYAPEAGTVSVAGSFNGWNGTPLAKDANGWWEARMALPAGTYEFVYVVDGKHVTPPETIVTVEDGFGGRNGVLEVVEPRRRDGL